MTEFPPGRLDARPHHGNLLNARVRRDIAGLNRLFLERALDPAHARDPWFDLPGTALHQLRTSGREALERAAQSPFTLFEMVLPAEGEAGPGAVGAVEDQPEVLVSDRSHREARRSFGMAVLSLVRSLYDGVPLAPRIAFGLGPQAEARLAALSLADSYHVAAWPGLIRPRWPTNGRYWKVLSELVTTPHAVHWAYATGLCLLAQCERQAPKVTYGTRRPPRPTHRRGVSDGPDVPC